MKRSLALLALGLLASTAHASASFPAPQGRVLVVSEDLAAAAPELLRPGTDPLTIGLPLGIRGTAAISPDGTRIAMVETLRLTPDLTEPVLLAADLLGSGGGIIASGVFSRPTWSPDGNTLAYAGTNAGNRDIFTIGIDALGEPSGDPVDLTASSAANETSPRWAPDGHAIAFESDRTGNLDVYTMKPDGSGVHDITNAAGADTLGDWSPDSQRLVFSSTRSGNGDVYSIPAGGGPALRLTSGPAAETRPAWSPDGATIAYSSDADGDNDVYEITPAGTNITKVTQNNHEDLVQDWQPLHDLSPPVVHALPSSGRLGRALRLRFKISEDTHRAGVTLVGSFTVKNGAGEFFETREIDGIRPGKVYFFTVPRFEAKGIIRLRFCVTGYDPSLNESKRSCARFHFLKPKKKKR